MNTQSDTPRTDAECGDIKGDGYFKRLQLHGDYVPVGLCQTLERELTSAHERIKELEALLKLDQTLRRKQEARIKRLEDCIETAWTLIANVSGGDWDKQHPDWQEATKEWRDGQFHPIMADIMERNEALERINRLEEALKSANNEMEEREKTIQSLS